MRHLGARNRVSPKLDRLGSREWQQPWSHGAASEVKFPALPCGLLASRARCWCSALLTRQEACHRRRHPGTAKVQVCLGQLCQWKFSREEEADGLGLLVCMWPAETFLPSEHPSSPFDPSRAFSWKTSNILGVATKLLFYPLCKPHPSNLGKTL